MFDTFIEKLKNKEPFSFARYGDGEWGAIFNSRPGGKNCDGHEFFPEMGEALKNILLSKPQYYLGMQRFAQEETHPKEITEFFKDNNLNIEDWINADLFHHASIKGYFEQFFDALKTREDDGIILVAPAYLRDLGKFFAEFVEVPEKNCWLERDRIFSEITEILDNKSKDVVVLFVASMMSNVMIDTLYKEYGKEVTLLDVGSVLDVYVGKTTRSYHKKVLQRLSEEKE